VITRLLAIARKEFLQLRRDRLTLAMMVALPLLQLLLFGYAINTDVRHIPTLVFDSDRTEESRSLEHSLTASGFYDVIGHVQNHEQIERAMRVGLARAALVIPAGYAKRLARGEPNTLQLIVDGSDPQTVASAVNTAASLVAARATRLLLRRFGPAGALGAPIVVEPSVWYNPELRTAVFVVPGLVGVILTMTMVMMTSMAIVRERERGTLEQLIVSPVRRVELVIGKIAPYIVIGYVQMTLVLCAGSLVFDVPISGSLALLYALAFVFIAANLALGLFFSTLAKTQQQAMQMSFFFLLPNILLSGFMLPFEAMPRPAQILAEALPLTHFLRIVRGITLKGALFEDVQQELIFLSTILVVLIALASTRFKKKLI
jgi:ABC-2 type transport system permease protein